MDKLKRALELLWQGTENPTAEFREAQRGGWVCSMNALISFVIIDGLIRCIGVVYIIALEDLIYSAADAATTC